MILRDFSNYLRSTRHTSPKTSVVSNTSVTLNPRTQPNYYCNTTAVPGSRNRWAHLREAKMENEHWLRWPMTFVRSTCIGPPSSLDTALRSTRSNVELKSERFLQRFYVTFPEFPLSVGCSLDSKV